MPSNKEPVVFVAGATGSVGGAICWQLSDIGWSINAITRSLDSPAAKSLAGRGVRIVEGGWDDEEVLKEQLRGVDMLFLLMSSSVRPGFQNTQVSQARRLLRLACEEGVQKTVYLSAMGVNDLDDWGITWDPASPMTTSMQSKQEIEALVRECDFPLGYTILRPGFFMTNFIGAKAAGYTATGTWRTAFLPETRLPIIDHEDIARFAVAAFMEPEVFRDAEITLFSEMKNPRELMEMLGKATGSTFGVDFMSEEEIQEGGGTANPFIMSQLAMRNMARFADENAPGTKWGIEMTGFSEFLEREKNALDETYAQNEVA